MRKKLLLALRCLPILLPTLACYTYEGDPNCIPTCDDLYSSGITPEEFLEQELQLGQLGGASETVVEAASATEFPTAFGVNPTNSDLAFVKYDQANGTSLEVYNAADDSTRQLVSPDAFGSTTAVGTMVQYSPDGSHVAFTVATLPSDVPPGDLDLENTEFTDEQLAAIEYKAYVADTADGALTEIVAPNEVAFNMLDWNQSSTEIALNGWSDDNGDGEISFYPELGGIEFQDSSQIYVHDVPSNTTTQVTDTNMNYMPTYVGDDLLWLTYEEERNIGIIKTPEGSVYGTDNLILSMKASPDDSQVAWVELPTNEARTEVAGFPELWVSDADFQNKRTLTELSTMIIPDPPVWASDSESILVSSTNLLEDMVGDYAESFGVSVPIELPAASSSVLEIDVASGEITTYDAGSAGNAGNLTGLISLIEMGALE